MSVIVYAWSDILKEKPDRIENHVYNVQRETKVVTFDKGVYAKKKWFSNTYKVYDDENRVIGEVPDVHSWYYREDSEDGEVQETG